MVVSIGGVLHVWYRLTPSPSFCDISLLVKLPTFRADAVLNANAIVAAPVMLWEEEAISSVSFEP